MDTTTNCKFSGGLKTVLLFAFVALCLFGYSLRYHSGLSSIICIIEVLFTRSDSQWMFYICFGVWYASFIALTFSWKDILLISLLLIAGFMYVENYGLAFQPIGAFILLAGVVLGQGVRFLLSSAHELFFIMGLVSILVSASWCHMNMTDNAYHGPRWMGLWDNPNTYGMLMGAGTVLAVGLLKETLKFEKRKAESGTAGKAESGNPPSHSYGATGRKTKTISRFIAVVKSAIFNPLSLILILAAGMLGVALVMSYSRGAWLGTAMGLTYLAWCYGKLKWRYVAIGVGFVALGTICLWGSTADSAPWYVKRADLGRPSAQHRATAWRAGLEIMRDHPLGVGWNNAISVYAKNYSPPENGAAAITTNDYLMLGTELGIASLICFVAYVALCLRGKCRIQTEEGRIRAACRAGAIVLLVAFWFDGGLFKLPTAALFWVLLELGVDRWQKIKTQQPQPETP